ncbi:uncharacterized protein ACN63O_004553 [Diretmus argenteus]
MSSRDSLGTGDLIPQDVVEVFAQKKLTKGGRKKRSNSLGRALGWLKGKKKKVDANGQNLGLGPGLDLALDGHPAGHQGGQKGAQKAGKQAGKQAHPQGNSHGVLKEEDKEKTLVPPLFQENVFIEASRPKYLEDLHTEAQEGLKLMQQEETNSGVEYRDDESSISTVQPEDDGRGFLSDSTTLDTASIVSTQSTISTRSSRSGLTRQGSTFRPLNSGKKPEKVKNRRRSRKTVMGIPQHVQRELGLDRTGWTISQVVDEEQLPNGETIDVPTIVEPHQSADPQEGGSVSPQSIEVLRSTQAGHRDDLALLQCLGSERSATQRPRSLAVPWMTTANSIQQQPPSPVMSMSPQATYLSKIIPNAVMPPSIEVVEISRGQSRSSLRTVSKSSLMLASPASSRASTRASSSRASTLSSASRYNPPHLSDSSCWSHSDSSETLVSNSSTISSNSTTRLGKSQNGDVEDSHEEDKVNVHSSGSKYSKSTSGGKPRTKGDEVKKEAPFVRSLSVMKSKRAPPPPSRSYSLHNKMKRRSRDLAEVRVISRESSPHNTSASGGKIVKNKPGEFKEAGSSPMSSRTTDSHGYTADTSSLDDSTGSVSISPLKSRLSEKEDSIKVEEPVAKDTSPEKHQSPQENGLKKIVSPSSGYSSQDGTPTQPSKRPHTSSPRHKRGILAKLQSLFPGSTHASVVSAPSPLTQPEAPESTKSTETPQPQVNPQLDTVISSPSVRALRELFNIPPPPKVHAPPPPPPEVWAHNKRTFELLLGPPAPNNSYAVVRKNPKDRRQQRPSPSISREGSVKSLSGERKQNSQTPPVESTNGSLHVLETRKVQESEQLNLKFHKESNERLAHVEQHVDVKGKSKVTEKDEKVRVSEIVNGMLVKAIEKHQERLAAIQQEETKTATHTQNSVTEPPTKQITPLGTPDAASATALQPAISPTRIPPPPLSIPPPPPYTAPGPPEKVDSVAPPVIEVSPPPPAKKVSPPPPAKKVSPPPPAKKVSLPPPTKKFSPPPPAKEVSPPLPAEVVSPPPPAKEVSPPPPAKEVSPPPPAKEVPPPPPAKEVSLPPPAKKVSPPSPADVVSPPPPAKEVSLPRSAKEVSPPPPTKEVSPPPPAEVVSPPPPSEVVSPPPPVKEVSPPPPAEVSPPPPAKEVSTPPPAKEVSPPPPAKEVSPPPPAKEVSPPPPAKEVSPPPPAKEVSPPPPAKEVSPLPPTKEVSLPPQFKRSPFHLLKMFLHLLKRLHQEAYSLYPKVFHLHHPKNLPLHHYHHNQNPFHVPPNTDGSHPAAQELPPPCPSEIPSPPPLETSTAPQVAQEHAPSPPVNIPLPPPLSVQASAINKHEPSPVTTKNQIKEKISLPALQEESTPIVTPSLLEMVQLRSLNSSPDPTEAQAQAQLEVSMRTKQPSNQVPTASANGEAPQKPIRRSLIMTVPSSTSLPVTSQPDVPKSQVSVAIPTSSSTVLSPTKKSPPAMTTSPSMNLQEAIRLRTAARTKDGLSARLGLQSPTSPLGGDLHKSPSSTASFIFSKSTKKVVIETTPLPETKANFQKNVVAELSSVTKSVNEAESHLKGIKVPPPVAKKPKAKAKEMDSSVETEQMQTAGQEAQPVSINGKRLSTVVNTHLT